MTRRRGAIVLTIIGVLLGVLVALWLYDADKASDAMLDGRAVGLQAGVLAGDTATVRWPSWTPEPTNTPRVYPSWTPEPTATSRRTPTWTATASATQAPTWTATVSVDPTITETVPMPPTHPPAQTATPAPPLPTKECDEPWPYSYQELQTIAAAARNHLWQGAREEPQTLPQEDALLSIGLYELDLGAPLTDEYVLEADDGGRVRCRGFCAAIVALRVGAPSECKSWAIVSWGGEPRE